MVAARVARMAAVLTQTCFPVWGASECRVAEELAPELAAACVTGSVAHLVAVRRAWVGLSLRVRVLLGSLQAFRLAGCGASRRLVVAVWPFLCSMSCPKVEGLASREPQLPPEVRQGAEYVGVCDGVRSDRMVAVCVWALVER